MSDYTNKITLVKNARGVWDLDPFKGCSDGLHSKYTQYNCGLNKIYDGLDLYNNNGCYGICYASKIAKFRGYDFSKTIKREFIDEKHLKAIGNKLRALPFVRMGVSCDPSHDWSHTISIIDKIKPYQKNIVIVTKYWKPMTESQLLRLGGITINISVSALDCEHEISKRLFWYENLKDYCNSVLRVNTADFNDEKLKKIQNELLENENVIDNILRFNKNHELVKNSIINVERYKFLDSYVYASKFNKETYFGYCEKCPDKCGINT